MLHLRKLPQECGREEHLTALGLYVFNQKRIKKSLLSSFRKFSKLFFVAYGKIRG